MHDKQLLPFPTEYRVDLGREHNADSTHILNDLLRDLDVSWTWDETAASGLCRAKDNVWSRSARRKKRKLEVTGTSMDSSTSENAGTMTEDKLVVQVTVQEAAVVLDWMKGSDTVLFESFCGFVKRALTTSGAR